MSGSKQKNNVEPKPDKELRKFIIEGGRPHAEKDFNEIIKRAAKAPKKKR